MTKVFVFKFYFILSCNIIETIAKHTTALSNITNTSKQYSKFSAKREAENTDPHKLKCKLNELLLYVHFAIDINERKSVVKQASYS